jgi:hypothetical protein
MLLSVASFVRCRSKEDPFTWEWKYIVQFEVSRVGDNMKDNTPGRNKQFAAVENPGFWHWTFTLKDHNQGRLAEIDRNWRGFGYEVSGR